MTDVVAWYRVGVVALSREASFFFILRRLFLSEL